MDNNPSETIYREKPLTTSFIDTPSGSAEEAFLKYIGEDNFWFGDFLFSLKKQWVDRGFKITDILIREDTPIQIATVKTYTTYIQGESEFGQKGSTLSPSRDDILGIVSLFANIPEEPKGISSDFSFFILGTGSFRGNFSVDSVGVGISLRYLSIKIPTFESIGYPSFYGKEIQRMIEKIANKTPYGVEKQGVIKQGGLILHVGSTGSGKTTAIAAELGFFSEQTRGTILTYEEPIEYRFMDTLSPVRQFEIGTDIIPKPGDTMTEAIQKHVLRNNPSVVSFGEGRTREDIRMMLETSLKGHLVMGTIHASNVKDALTVLSSAVRGEEYILSNGIKAIIAHKLHVNKSGEIVPIFEIWIATEQDKIHIQKGDMSKVTDLLYGVTGTNSSTGMSFMDHIDILISEGKLTHSEASIMIEAMKDVRKVKR